MAYSSQAGNGPFRWLTMKYKLNYAYSILALEDEETATRNISLNQQLSLRFSPLPRLAWNWLQNTITMSHPLTEQEISSWPISYCPIKFLLMGNRSIGKESDE